MAETAHTTTEFDASTLGDRMPVGDPRGITAHASYGEHQDAFDSTLEADRAHARFRRSPTALELSLLEHIGAYDPTDETDKRPVAVANTWRGPIRCQVFTRGRSVLTDPRLVPTTTDTTTTEDDA